MKKRKLPKRKPDPGRIIHLASYTDGDGNSHTRLRMKAPRPVKFSNLSIVSVSLDTANQWIDLLIYTHNSGA